MIKDPRVKAKEIGDADTLERENLKREAWLWENELRRHNFVGFLHEITKVVARKKLDEGNFEPWISQAKERAKTQHANRLEAGDPMEH